MGFRLRWVLLGSTGSRGHRLQDCNVWPQYLWLKVLVVLHHVRSSWNRDGAHVPCIDRWILYHWTTRGVRVFDFLKETFMSVFKG